MRFHKYQGAGNDFLIADNRPGSISLTPERIAALCDRRYGVGADGLMLLETAPEPYGFRMVYYNSDGSGGMMCGNGGRCIVAFAERRGLPVDTFLAPDGPHMARVLDRDGACSVVTLRMRDVSGIEPHTVAGVHGCYLDTGTRHFVAPVASLAAYDVDGVGKAVRYSAVFAPEGVNANFIERVGGVLHVRTYEKGVEAETYACGTGITAAAIAEFHMRGLPPADSHRVHVPVRALRDELSVDFTPTATGATDVWLTGPATYVAEIIV